LYVAPFDRLPFCGQSHLKKWEPDAAFCLYPPLDQLQIFKRPSLPPLQLPKWVGGQVNGYYFRQSAKTRQWAEAEEVRLRLEEALVKGLPPFGLAMAYGSAPRPTHTPANPPPPASRTKVLEPRVPKPRPRVTVAQAVEAYLADAVSRSVETSTLKKLETIFRKQFLVWTRVEGIEYEAIRNACVHSTASQLEVELTYGQDLALRVADNGVGIDSEVADRGKDGHFGIQGMRERAVRIGGRLTLESSPNSGTEMKLIVPGSIVSQKLMQPSPFARLRTLGRRKGHASKLD
jgi:hypothetical protein